MTTATLADTGRERCFRSSARAASHPRTGPASPVSAALRAENSFINTYQHPVYSFLYYVKLCFVVHFLIVLYNDYNYYYYSLFCQIMQAKMH